MRILAALGAIAVAIALVVFLFLGKGGDVVNPEEPFKVEDAYARAVGASAMAGAAYMAITNQSGQDDVLIAAKTDASAMAELHTHIEDGDGIMMMRQIEGGIQLAAGETVVMKRGGDHVMLMGLNGALDAGQTLTLTLTFEKAGEIVVDVPVDNNR
ncbi:copper chaperone PCu(A)C [Amylibacter sp. IMCC11727]|uniref:copper chaperone PCu(A)C n=1 Tax=Amylibacter sp. IMCC11727 TaxID=3039851 RepID=UPI00244E2F02|nr:copper chaperone PCu(A)C [Amylibacter sp. IMCC11727]WGI22943.1 copper chaperone PCu(A)C [Amylibacter sp. IMCC11727]